MSSDQEKAEPTPDAEHGPALVLDLDFVPAWARQAPGADPYPERFEERRPRRDAGGDRPRRGERPRGPGDRRPGDRSQGRTGARPGDRPGARPGARPGTRPGGERDGDRRGPRREQAPQDRGPRRESAAAEPLLPIQISFVPEQAHLSTVMGDIRASQHAFPLPELAHLFLSKPEWHLVKFEALSQKGGTPVVRFFQCRLTGRLFMNRDEALQAAATDALERCFSAEVTQKDPPAGQFICVGRCGLSGQLLGPPNHHAFQEQLELLHRTRFAHMDINEYRDHVENVRDPEVVEQWKEQWRTHTVYRLKEEFGGDPAAEPMDEKAARAHAVEVIAPGGVKEVTRAVLPGPVSRSITDPRLLQLLRAAWTREQRFPVTLVRALKAAARRMGLFTFETSGRAAFVSPIAPRPVDPARVVDSLRLVLEWLQAHPGCTRQELIHGVRPEVEADPTRLGEVLQPMSWLVEKGHVIEFNTGRLAVPRASTAVHAPVPRAAGRRPRRRSGRGKQ